MEVKFVLSDAITRYARFHITASGIANLVYLCGQLTQFLTHDFWNLKELG